MELEHLESVRLTPEGKLVIIDQTRLPGELVYIELNTLEDMADAIYQLPRPGRARHRHLRRVQPVRAGGPAGGEGAGGGCLPRRPPGAGRCPRRRPAHGGKPVMGGPADAGPDGRHARGHRRGGRLRPAGGGRVHPRGGHRHVPGHFRVRPDPAPRRRRRAHPLQRRAAGHLPVRHRAGPHSSWAAERGMHFRRLRRRDPPPAAGRAAHRL